MLLVTWYHTRTGWSSGKWSNPGTAETGHKNTWFYTYQGEEIIQNRQAIKKKKKHNPLSPVQQADKEQNIVSPEFKNGIKSEQNYLPY